MKLSEAVARSHVAELRKDLADDPVLARKLAACVASAMGFCAEPETFPVFLQYFVNGYPGEQGEKLRQLDRKTFAESMQYVLAQLDPEGLIELMIKGIEDVVEERHGTPLEIFSQVNNAGS